MGGPRRAGGKRDRLQRAFERGMADRSAGKAPDQNPYFVAPHRVAWRRGWETQTPPSKEGA